MKENFMREIFFEQMQLAAGAGRSFVVDGGEIGAANYGHIESNTTSVSGVETTVYRGWNDPATGDLPYPDEYWYPTGR
jgi:hypothetical protein